MVKRPNGRADRQTLDKVPSYKKALPFTKNLCYTDLSQLPPVQPGVMSAGRGQEAFIRPLAKLAQAVKVADASNQRKAKCKTVSAIAVALREDTKSFDKADNVFNKDTIL